MAMIIDVADVGDGNRTYGGDAQRPAVTVVDEAAHQDISPEEIEAELQRLVGDEVPESDSELVVTTQMIDKMVKAAGLKSPMSVKELRAKLVDTLIQKTDWEIEDFVDLRKGDKPERGEVIIENFLRQGEVAFLGSVSKAGKSWMVGNLIWSVVSGSPWLGKQVKKGKVLLIDNELKRRELDWRHTQTAREMLYEPGRGDVVTICRRGKDCDITNIAGQIIDKDWSGYSLIVIDAIYKTIPDGKSENDNEAMGKLMNTLQSIGEETGVAIMAVHHATKGDQSSKTTLDILSGAGSFARALDSMVAIRDHEADGLNVVEFRTRTFPDPVPISVKFEWPIWVPVATEPMLRAAGKRPATAPDEKIFALVEEEWKAGRSVSPSVVKGRLGTNKDRAAAALARLQDAGRLDCEMRPNRIKNGDPVPYYSPKILDENEGTK